MGTRLAPVLLPAILAAGLAALILGWLALSPGGARPAPPPYVEGVVGRPEHLHPLLGDAGAGADLAALVFDGLVEIDGAGIPRPNLAARWEVTPDGRTYTVVLRDDVTWHDGRPLDSADVAFTLAQLQAPDFRGPPALAAPWSDVEIFVADARTVLFRLPDTRPGFLSRLAVPILPRHLLEGETVEAADALLLERAVGSGPFRLVELTDRGARLERNTSYHRGTPGIAAIEIRFFDDGAALAAAVEAGTVGAALIDGALPALPAAAAATGLQRNAFVVLYLNHLRPPLDDAALRRAIAGSLDRDAIIAAAGRPGVPGAGVIVPGSWAAPERPSAAPPPSTFWAVAGWLLDPDGRRVRNGERLSLSLVTNASPEREAVAAEVARQLDGAGIDVTVEALPATQLLQVRLQPRDYDLALFGWESAVDPDPYSGWHSSQISAQGRNIAGFQVPVADALLEAARATLDGGERRALYAEFDALFEQRGGSAVLYYPVVTYVHPATLVPEPGGLLFERASRFRGVHRWTLAPPG